MLLLDTDFDNPSPVRFIAGHTANKTIQIALEGDANVTLYGRMAPDAPWIAIKAYTESAIETIDPPKYLYADRDVGTGRARIWLS